MSKSTHLRKMPAMTTNASSTSEPITLESIEKAVAGLLKPPVIYYHPDDAIRLQVVLELMLAEACKTLPMSSGLGMAATMRLEDLGELRASQFMLIGMAWSCYGGSGRIIDFRNDTERERDAIRKNTAVQEIEE